MKYQEKKSSKINFEFCIPQTEEAYDILDVKLL